MNFVQQTHALATTGSGHASLGVPFFVRLIADVNRHERGMRSRVLVAGRSPMRDSFGDVGYGEFGVEDFSRVDLADESKINEVGQEAAEAPRHQANAISRNST